MSNENVEFGRAQMLQILAQLKFLQLIVTIQ